MAYTTISQLPLGTVQTLNSEDYLLVSSGSASYKVDLNTVKDFMASIYNLDDFVIENKDITSISNTIHATSLHYKTLAGVAGLKRGDLVTLLPHDHELMDSLGLPDLPAVQKADNRYAPAIGIVKSVHEGNDWVLESDTFEKETSDQWDVVVVTVAGIFTPFDTSTMNDGEILWLGEDAQFTTTKPINDQSESGFRMQQACGFTLFTCPADDPEHNGAIQVLFANPEQHAHDVFYNGWEYTNEKYTLQSKDVESAISEVFYKSHQHLVTLDHFEIVDNKIDLSILADGDIVYGSARIWDTDTGTVYEEFTCEVGSLYNTIEFDPVDNLSGKFATLTYIGAIPWTGERPWDPNYED